MDEQENTDTTTGSGDSGSNGDSGKGKGDGSDIPEWVADKAKAYAEIQKLRDEAAKERTKRTDAEKKLTEREKAEQEAQRQKLIDGKDYQKLYEQSEREKAEALASARVEKLAALRLKVGTAAGLPVEISERLMGASEDELKKDAEKLKGLIPANGKGGSSTTANPSGKPGEMTYEQRKSRRYGGGSGNPFKG